MKFTIISTGLLVIYTMESVLSSPCAVQHSRKDIRDLTPSEWEATKSALRNAYRDGIFDRYAEIHSSIGDRVFHSSQMFPWCRQVTREFERDIQRYYPEFVMPYWDTSPDFRAPAESDVLTPRLIGGNGNQYTGCVVDGVQGNWTMMYPEPHCLRRHFSGGNSIPSWNSPESSFAIRRISKTMASLQTLVGTLIYTRAAETVQGDLGSGYSPNDFAYMLILANIDRIWASWQSTGNEKVVDGESEIPGVPMTLDSLVPYFEVPVRSVLRLGEDDFCYSYQPPFSSPELKDECWTVNAIELNLASSLPKDLLTKWFPGIKPRPDRNAINGVILDNGHICPRVSDPIPMLVPQSNQHESFYVEREKWAYEIEAEFVTDLANAGYLPLH